GAFLQRRPGAAPVRGLTGWLADSIRAAIMDGRLRAGAPLPATRLLASDLGISRGVIVEAYQRLADEGLVSARPGAGTRVLGVSRPTQAPAGPTAVTGATPTGSRVAAGPGLAGWGAAAGLALAGSRAAAGAALAGSRAAAGAPLAGSRGSAGWAPNGSPAAGALPVPGHSRERAEIDLSPGVPDLSGFP